MAPNGARKFFPTNPNLADNLGRTEFDFESFYFLDLFGYQISRFPESRFPNFQKSGLGQAWAGLGWAWALVRVGPSFSQGCSLVNQCSIWTTKIMLLGYPHTWLPCLGNSHQLPVQKSCKTSQKCGQHTVDGKCFQSKFQRHFSRTHLEHACWTVKASRKSWGHFSTDKQP